jgi:Holliday junction resolvasome RuvABC endonuclease subunit
MSMSTFDGFLKAAQSQRPRPNGPFRGRLLALDPGETTGWSVWDSHNNATHYEMVECGQLETWDKTNNTINPCVTNFPKLLTHFEPDEVVYESYRVYEWKAESHSWSDVPTLRIIGSMETRIIDANLPYCHQTAQVAKKFVTDDLLKSFGFYQRGQRHSRDSMRHALYYILFGKQPS